MTTAHPPRLPDLLGAPHLPDAACHGHDPDLWTEYDRTDLGRRKADSAADRMRVQAAKVICSACPEQLPCLEWALAHPEEVGVWGGTTTDERNDLRRPNPTRRGIT